MEKKCSHQFKEAGIPCFMDDKRTITENPLVELDSCPAGMSSAKIFLTRVCSAI